MLEAQFNELVRTHNETAYRIALKLTGGRADEAQDLVQDGFVKIWRVWPEQAPRSFQGWMYRVFHNLYIDKLRRKSRRAETPLESSGDETHVALEDRLPDPNLRPDEVLIKEERRQAVSQALAALEEDLRLPVTLCDIDGLSYEEIAKIAACPVGTVRSRIHRGRSKLRQALAVAAALVAVGWAMWRTYTYPVLWKPLEIASPEPVRYHAVALQPTAETPSNQDLQ